MSETTADLVAGDRVVFAATVENRAEGLVNIEGRVQAVHYRHGPGDDKPRYDVKVPSLNQVVLKVHRSHLVRLPDGCT